MTADSLDDLKETIDHRADQILDAGGTDITVAICGWRSDRKIVVLEWFDGDDLQREIIGHISSPPTETASA